MIKSLPLVIFCAYASRWLGAAFSQECWSMGETCGDDAKCSGMGTHCGDRSECSGSSTTCGAYSICSGMDSQCGPGSECTGLGAQCNGGSESQTQSESDMDFKPMHFKPMKPMHFKPMHFDHSETERPQQVFVNGCDQGDVCDGRPDAAQSSGVTVCCREGCGKCSASTSQDGDTLTATCVCKEQATSDDEQQEPMHFKPMKPMHFKPMKPMHFKPMHFDDSETERPQQVFVNGCDQGDACSGRPGAAQSNGVTVCCQEDCGECSASTSQDGNTLTATCQCKALATTTEKPEPQVKAMGCEMGSACHGRPGAAETAGVSLCCPASCPSCMVYGTQQDGVLTAMCMCALSSELAEAPAEPEARAKPEAQPEGQDLVEDVAAGTMEATNAALALGVGLVWLFVAVAAGKQAWRLRQQPDMQQPLLSA